MHDLDRRSPRLDPPDSTGTAARGLVLRDRLSQRRTELHARGGTAVGVERREEPRRHSTDLTTVGAGPAARQHDKPDAHDNHERLQTTGTHPRNLEQGVRGFALLEHLLVLAAISRRRLRVWRMTREICIWLTPNRSPISCRVRSSSKRSRRISRVRCGSDLGWHHAATASIDGATGLRISGHWPAAAPQVPWVAVGASAAPEVTPVPPHIRPNTPRASPARSSRDDSQSGRLVGSSIKGKLAALMLDNPAQHRTAMRRDHRACW